MLLFVNGKKVSLSSNNFVAKGGEGSIFEKDNLAYKIYEDQNKMIPEAKIKELMELDKSNIIRPINIIYDKNRKLIGFTMNWLNPDNTHALCKLFTNNFRNVHSIENDMIIELVENMKEVISFIHDKKCLIVDGNELNYLVDKDFITPYFIDVNSWQTRNFPATAIMPSIRDWKTNTFSVLSDWFSFAIVTFQLFIGIHPFKGKHEKFKNNDFEARVKNCVSVFNNKVRIPPSARDLSLIPSAYKDWYYKLFEKGDRELPPTLPGTAQKVPVKVILIQSTDNFEIKFLYELDEDILYVNPKYNVTKTKSKLYIGKTSYKVPSGTEVLFTPLENIPVFVNIENKQLQITSVSSYYKVQNISIECNDLMIVDNTLYLKQDSKLIELDLHIFKDKIVPSIKSQWTIEPRSSVLFSNMIVQSVLGKAYIVIPLPSASKSSCIVQAVPELNDYKIIDAKYDNGVAILVGHKNGKYDRIIIKFAKSNYVCNIIEDIDYSPINFITLDNGVCIQIVEEALEIFLNRTDKPDVKRIEDPKINHTIRLVRDGTLVKFFQGKKFFQMRMK